MNTIKLIIPKKKINKNTNLKILTWNILASEWIDDETYNMVDKKILYNNKERIQKIITYLLKSNADIILLQEVMPYEYNKIKKAFDEKYNISMLQQINWDTVKNNSGNVSLFKKSIFHKNNLEHNALDFGICTKCIYKKKDCVIFNIHLDDSSINARYKQIKSITPIIDLTTNCIISGDFNHQYNKNTKFYKIPDFTIHNKCPSYYIEKKMTIDNILSKGFKILPNSTCPLYPENIEHGFIKYGSDHLPITAVIGEPT
jgi:mRNA deadenylase 3'-5' endonuclease subunit Ccr4